jgi:hypothetical protein
VGGSIGVTLPDEVTGIVVPVPEAAAYADHPHVTLLAPFRTRERLEDPDLQQQLRDLFADIPPWDFALTDISVFPAGVTYLTPVPDDPFRLLTIALAAMFPDCPPYGGLFRDIIPHLSVATIPSTDVLPIRSRAHVAHLVHSHGTVWDVFGTFHLAGRAAG